MNKPINRKLKRNLLIAFLLIVAIAAGTGLYFFNKGPQDVKHSSAAKITAEILYRDFWADSTSAREKYAGKILQVEGEVSGISVNQQKQKVILFKTNTNGASVNCTMEEDPGNITTHTKLSIKGICSGMGQADEDLGIKADLYLTRCYLVK